MFHTAQAGPRGHYGAKMAMVGKRAYEQAMSGDARALDIELGQIDTGTDFGRTMANYVAQTDPLLQNINWNDGIEQHWATFMDWAMQHPRNLGTLVQLTFAQTSAPIFSSVLPIVYLEEAIHKKTIHVFKSQPAELGTLNTVPRNISMTQFSIEGRRQWTSQLVHFDKYHLKGPDGPRYFSMMTDALFANIMAYVQITAWTEFAETPSYYRELNQLFPGTAPPQSPVEALRYEARYYGVVSREPLGLQKIINRESSILLQGQTGTNGAKCAYLLATTADTEFVLTHDKTQQLREFSGAGAPAVIKRTTATLASVGDTAVISVPFIGTEMHNEYNDNVLRTRNATGGFWRFRTSFLARRAADFRTADTTIYAVPWSRNTWTPFTIGEAARADPHFRPLNADLDGVARDEHEGRLDRQWLNQIGYNIARKAVRGVDGGFYHDRTGTSFARKEWEVDYMLRHNAFADATQTGLYAVQCFGELDERKLPTWYLEYVAATLHARLVKGLSEEQQRAYEEGLALMRDLAREFKIVQHGALSDALEGDAADPYRLRHYRPNAWGGPDFQQAGGRNSFDPRYLGGLGTVAGFLTISHEVKRTRRAGGSVAYSKARGTATQIAGGVNSLDADAAITAGVVGAGAIKRLDTVFAFLDVYETLVRRLMAIFPDLATFSEEMLPRHHRHAQMQAIHRNMIIASYFLVGPFQYPVVENPGQETYATGNVPAGPAPAAPAVTTATVDREENTRAFDYVKFWGTLTAAHPAAFPNALAYVARVVKGRAALEEIHRRLVSNDSAKRKLSDDEKAALVTKYNEVLDNRQIGNVAFTALGVGAAVDASVAAIRKFLDALFATTPVAGTPSVPALAALEFVEQILQKPTYLVPAAAGDATTPAQPGAGAADINTALGLQQRVWLNRLIEATNVAGAGVRGQQTDVANLQYHIRQYHFDDAVIRAQPTDARQKLWRAGISALPLAVPAAAAGARVWGIDAERPGEQIAVLFDEHYATSVAGTLYAAGPFIDARVPPAPCSGALAETDPAAHTGDAALLGVSPQRTRARYASGYPLTEVVARKRDAEVQMIKAYEALVNKPGSYDDMAGRLKALNLPPFMLHGLAHPYAGAPNGAELTDMDRRWMWSHTKSPLEGFAMRALLMLDITLQNIQRMETHDIAPMVFYLIAQPFQTQYMHSFVATTAEAPGRTIFEKEGFDRITSFDAAPKQYTVEETLAHTVFIDKAWNFHIAEYGRGGGIIGGSGAGFLTAGVSRRQQKEWNERCSLYATPEMLGEHTNFAIMQSFTAACAEGPFDFDLRGRWNRGDWVGRCALTAEHFPSVRTTPQAEGLVVLNEAFQFPSNNAEMTLEEATFQKRSNRRRRNFVVQQQSQLVHVPGEQDGLALIKSNHLWGETLEGWKAIAESSADINISDHFEGQIRPYFSTFSQAQA